MNKEELLEKIQSHNFIVITGTSDGRKQVRQIVNRNIPKKRIIETRKYPEYIKNRKSVDSYNLSTESPQPYEALMSLLKILEKKRLPVIVDSFTDIKSILRTHVHGTTKNWVHYNFLIKNSITTLQKYNTKLILFVDDEVIHQHLLYLSDLIIIANDNETKILKEK